MLQRAKTPKLKDRVREVLDVLVDALDELIRPKPAPVPIRVRPRPRVPVRRRS